MILLPVIKVMDGISIIPVDSEILGRRPKPGKPTHRIIRIRDPLRVRILGHAPHPFYGLVLRHQFVDHIHIRPCGQHGNTDHLDAKVFRNGKMTVIARHRTEEFYLI